MWQQLINRIAPMMDEEISVLDLADGLGFRAEQDVLEPVVVTAPVAT